MDKQFFWDILDQKRKNILPLFKEFKAEFYLAGGTALALQLGHRDSIDFDFFAEKSFSTEDLTQKIEQIFQNHKVAKIQEEKDTLTFVIDETVKISFFAYLYKLIKSLLDEDNFKMASLEDIGAMKLSAITSRSILKDYVDLYFILHEIELDKLLEMTKEKFPMTDTNPIIKSLVYFDDIQEEPILFKHGDDIGFESIKKYLSETVTNYLAKIDK
ncbi:MAG: nucleotidyl transferase AbiEii/AbiGii toxin family protein [Candidatus Berkelbacteria bacterium]|nr:nucleotidyl transferase AbiEii/AbiGii toxin family protein [Candidatus Berkelbacteria bacterium]